MDKAKLRTLRDLLRKNAANPAGAKFDLMDFGTVLKREEPMSCNTSACGIGLAAISGAFPELTYHADPIDGDIEFFLNGYHKDPLEAAALLFGISEAQSFVMFGGGGQPRTQGAPAELLLADRIDYLIKTGLAPVVSDDRPFPDRYGVHAARDADGLPVSEAPEWHEVMARPEAPGEEAKVNHYLPMVRWSNCIVYRAAGGALAKTPEEGLARASERPAEAGG